MEFPWWRVEMGWLQGGGIRQFELGLRRRRNARRRDLRWNVCGGWRGFRRWRDGLGAYRAQIAFDHGQPIDHMAERVVNGLQRILGVAVGFRLAETDIGQFAF